MPITINIRADVKALSKAIDNARYKQLPYATALAVTALAKRVAREEVKNLAAKFPTATPFTLSSVGVKSARKDHPVATIYVKDIAARYLEPYEDGGKHVLNSRALLNPKNIGLNQYGNLPRAALARLKGRKDVFIGTIATKSGQKISGVWQRPIAVKGKAAHTGALKLLIRFGDALPVKEHLGWGAKAEQTVHRWFKAEFDAAFRKALATAK